MGIETKKPRFKQTVGAQYIVFATDIDSFLYESDIEKTETVKNISTTENTESTKIRASGKIYGTVNSLSDIEISTEVIAFVVETLAKMKGETVTANGLFIPGTDGDRPFFAYGKVVELSEGAKRFEWFPRCQLTANTDDIATKEESFSEQTDTLTLSAMPFPGNPTGKVYVQTDSEKFPVGLTEELFFAQVIHDEISFDAIIPESEDEGV